MYFWWVFSSSFSLLFPLSLSFFLFLSLFQFLSFFNFFSSLWLNSSLFPFFNLFSVKSFSPSFHFEKKLSSFIATWDDLLSWSSLSLFFRPFGFQLNFERDFFCSKVGSTFHDLIRIHFMQWLWQRNTDSVWFFTLCAADVWLVVESAWIEISCFKHVLIEHEGVCFGKKKSVRDKERERERWNDNVEQMYLMKCKWNCFHYNWEEIWASLRHGSFMTCIDFRNVMKLQAWGKRGNFSRRTT